MKIDRKGVFFRVQSSKEGVQSNVFKRQTMPSGRSVVSMRRTTYEAARKAAAEAMGKSRQPQLAACLKVAP
jgi:hypothetical protein